MSVKIIDTTYIKRRWIDIKYADNSETQKLDIYLPHEGKGPFPVIFSIHGGAFMFGDKRDEQLEPMLEGLNRGYAVVSVNYRLSGEEIFPANIYDVKAAIRFIKAHSEEYMLDKNKIVAWGGSAGGNLSALLGISYNSELEDLSMGNPNESCEIQAVIDWFGPTDFLKMDEQLKEAGLGPQDHGDEDSPESRVLGGKICNIPHLVKKANPITYITDNVPPFLIQHGSIDNIVPNGQSKLLYEALVEKVGNRKVTFEIIEGASHGGPLFRTLENIGRVFKFIDNQFKYSEK
jgi:acetyl esterase/lipase